MNRLPVSIHEKYVIPKRFGSFENREKCISNANYQCQKCGMSREEHKLKYNCDLTVDHIDGNGRKSVNPNNKPENLQALCKKCHGQKDGLRADYSKRRSFAGENHPMAKLNNKQWHEIYELRSKGLTFKEIGEMYNISASHIWTIVKKFKEKL